MTLGRAVAIVRTQGIRWAAFRARYAFEHRAGLIERRTPLSQWNDRPLPSWLRPGVPATPEEYVAWRRPHGGRFFFEAPVTLPQGVAAKAPAAADALLDGRWSYFSGELRRVGFPPDWFCDPLSGRTADSAVHWSRDAGGPADIKMVWEPSRFAAAFLLARAYAVRPDERYAEGFWTLVEDWMAKNPPMHGPNWGCGQEATFRVMGWCFGLAAFAGAAATTPARVAALAAAIAWHGERIEANIAYARSQKNNHAISEAIGLWMIGLLFPEFSAAERWVELGRHDLEAEVARQIYPDGSYVQHSTNYHRVMLQDLTWAIRLGEVNGRRLSAALYERAAAATQWLFNMTDADSGGAPLTGHNDGALILPLSDADFSDYRPAIQAASWIVLGTKPFENGVWDEPLAWLAGSGAIAAAAQSRCASPLVAPDGGYYTLRGPESWALLRCAAYADRPAHADQLHLDLWWRGHNVAGDAGTWRYTAEDGRHNPLATTAVHNTVTVDGRDQMTAAGRFLWIDWATGTVARRECVSGMDVIDARHDGYRAAGVTHRRAVVRRGDVWVLVDDILGSGTHEARLHWLCPDVPVERDGQAALFTYPSGRFAIARAADSGPWDIVRASPEGVRGWRSPIYAAREPAISLVATVSGALPLRFVTVLGPAGFDPRAVAAALAVVS